MQFMYINDKYIGIVNDELIGENKIIITIESI